ncbi:hypothetical protein GPALN_014906 [Globodera pallida]|nr:hypothetical protein GPALN_014906 [Globodera pallida]
MEDWTAAGEQQRILKKYFLLAPEHLWIVKKDNYKTRTFFCRAEGACDCKIGGTPANKLWLHIERHHKNLPELMELKEQIEAVQKSHAAKKVENPGALNYVHSACFMCGESFINDTFARHRQKCSDGLPRFGCRARKDFYHKNGLWVGLKDFETSSFKNKTKEQLLEMRNGALRELANALSEEPGPKGVYIKCLPDQLNIFGLRYVGQGHVRQRQYSYGVLASTFQRHIVPDNYSSFDPKAFGATLQMLLLAEELSDKFARTIEYGLIQMLDLPTKKFVNVNYPWPFYGTQNDAAETTYVNMLPAGISDSDLRSLVAPLLFIALELREELSIDMSGRGQQKMDADAPLISTPTSSMKSLDEMPGTSAASEDPWQRHAPKGWEQKPAREWTKTDREMYNKHFLEKEYSKKPQSSSQPNKYF